MKNSYILFFLIFLISCAQLDGGELNKNRQDVMTEKVENRDINLPSGSTILDEDGGFTLEKLLSGITGSGSDSVGFSANGLMFNVSLDQLSFMPLLSVDANAGVIVTDWYGLGEGNDRIKINVRISGQELVNENIKVTLFKQSYDGSRWIDKGQDTEQAFKIEKSILQKAIALEVASQL